MITRRGGYLRPRRDPAPEASVGLERDGYAVLPAVLGDDELAALKAEVTEIFEASPPDRALDTAGEFRHGMFNRSALAQSAIGARAILDVLEPLLGEDCHVIANTAWRNVAGHRGGAWHIDAGPHVPRSVGIDWPEAIPYPIFAIGLHLFLEDCPPEAGPTAVLPGSHRSGRAPPSGLLDDLTVTYEGRPAVLLSAKAGDAALFVSDAWHRGTPALDGHGRFFLQAHYGRRDIAQRIFPTDEVSHALPEAIHRATEPRQRTLIGLHPIRFYDG